MRRTLIAMLAVALLVTGVAPAVAQSEMMASDTTITAHDPSFSWTGKEGMQANYAWSTTLTNPSRRDATVNVTLQLLDAQGEVVAADSQTLMLERESEVEVSGEASLAYEDATSATQYRIMVEGVED